MKLFFVYGSLTKKIKVPSLCGRGLGRGQQSIKTLFSIFSHREKRQFWNKNNQRINEYIQRGNTVCKSKFKKLYVVFYKICFRFSSFKLLCSSKSPHIECFMENKTPNIFNNKCIITCKKSIFFILSFI